MRRRDQHRREHVLQLADVARPVVARERGDGVRRQRRAAPGPLRQRAPQMCDEQRQILQPLAQRRQRDRGRRRGDTRDRRETRRRRPPQRAADSSRRRRARPPCGRTFSPRRRISPSCSVRSSLACTRWPSSATSSRNSVPPLASSNRPCRSAVAPVKAPFTWPKSSASTSSSTSAAQLTAQKRRSRRALREWIARAASSLPDPLSPSMTTGNGDCAARTMASRTATIAALSPTSSGTGIGAVGRRLRPRDREPHARRRGCRRNAEERRTPARRDRHARAPSAPHGADHLGGVTHRARRLDRAVRPLGGNRHAGLHRSDGEIDAGQLRPDTGEHARRAALARDERDADACRRSRRKAPTRARAVCSSSMS